MTYCVGISLKSGLVFASDSRTNAGTDQVSQYGKLHTLGVEGERQFVLLSAGNLATTQAVLTHIRHELRDNPDCRICKAHYMDEVADYIGEISRDQQNRFHASRGVTAGFSPTVSFILGGQIAGEPASIHLIYSEGNHITTSHATPYLQIGEAKYGKVNIATGDRLSKSKENNYVRVWGNVGSNPKSSIHVITKYGNSTFE